MSRDPVEFQGFFLITLEDRDKRGTTRHKHEGDGNFEEVFFGRLVRLIFSRHALPSDVPPLLPQIEEGTARPLMKTFDVKKRSYYGNTIMEAEISLIMANQTLVRSSSRCKCVSSELNTKHRLLQAS